jgi:hypothetical protein
MSEDIPIQDRRAMRQLVWQTVECPHCRASVGRRCYGQASPVRLGSHKERMQAFQALTRAQVNIQAEVERLDGGGPDEH